MKILVRQKEAVATKIDKDGKSMKVFLEDDCYRAEILDMNGTVMNDGSTRCRR